MSNPAERTPDDTRKHNRSQRNALIAILDEHLNEALESEHPHKLELIALTKDGRIVSLSAVRAVSYDNTKI